MAIEFIFGLLGVVVVIYMFKLADEANENEFLVGICLVWGPLIFILALISIIMGLIDIIQYFIH